MTKLYAALAMSAAVLVACGPGDDAAGDGAFNTSMPMNEVMGHVIDPGAWAYWDRSGYVSNDAGELIDRAPARPESIPDDPNSIDDDVQRIALEDEWHRAISGAAQVAEGGNLLLLPGRVMVAENENVGPTWSELAIRLTEVSLEAMEAAEAFDGDAMFEVGGRMYEVCVACHEKYLLPLLDENGELPNGVDAEGNPVKE